MAKFARVESGEVVEVFDALPLNWRHISNFYLLGNDGRALAELGWHAVVGQPYDVLAKEPVSRRYEFVEGQVFERLILADRNAVANLADDDLRRVRTERDRLLAASDWTQALDLHQRFARWASAWAEHRQRLRDFPFLYEQSHRTLTLPTSPPSTPQPESRHAG